MWQLARRLAGWRVGLDKPGHVVVLIAQLDIMVVQPAAKVGYRYLATWRQSESFIYEPNQFFVRMPVCELHIARFGWYQEIVLFSDKQGAKWRQPLALNGCQAGLVIEIM